MREATENLERAESILQSAGGALVGMELQMQHLPEPISRFCQQVGLQLGMGRCHGTQNREWFPWGGVVYPGVKVNATEPDPSSFPFSGTGEAQPRRAFLFRPWLCDFPAV